MLIYSKYHTRPLFSYFTTGNERLTTTANARSLGVVLDDNKLFDVQLRNLSKIRKYLTRESSEIAVHAFITSKLDYCNSLLYGCRKTQLKKLQNVQHTAARIVTQTRKFDHITPVLFNLHWLPVGYRIVFKILLLVFHMIVRIVPIVPVVSKNVQTIGTIIWKRYPDDRKRPGRLRRPRSLG